MRITGKQALKLAHKLRKTSNLTWSEILKNAYKMLKIDFLNSMIETAKANKNYFMSYKHLIVEVEKLKSLIIKKNNDYELADINLNEIDFKMF